MEKTKWISLIFLLIACNVFSQNMPELIENVKQSVCENDTTKIVSLLEKFEKEHPRGSLIIRSNRALAKIYLKRGQTQKAIEKLTYALNYVPEDKEYYYRELDSCKAFLDFRFGNYKSDICVEISDIFLQEKDFENALIYLNFADNEHFPYQGGCLNGILMYKSYLSQKFADYYLQIGDTAKATTSLLDYFMEKDGDYILLTKKLKEILLKKYTKEEISNEIKKGIDNLKIVAERTKTNPIKVVRFTIFNHTINKSAYQNKKLKYYRTQLTNDESIKILLSE
ncbi:MAG: hypothetical protein PSV16_04020 [Flavobacterium sp.]|nr:hypothetical protein [Flavobacterium sp.]